MRGLDDEVDLGFEYLSLIAAVMVNDVLNSIVDDEAEDVTLDVEALGAAEVTVIVLVFDDNAVPFTVTVRS